jgi:hypothetical protein
MNIDTVSVAPSASRSSAPGTPHSASSMGSGSAAGTRTGVEDQIADAKKRALQYAESLRVAREQESKALKTLEFQQSQWINANEEQTVKIQQLERELESAVETIQEQRKAVDSFTTHGNEIGNSNGFAAQPMGQPYSTNNGKGHDNGLSNGFQPLPVGQLYSTINNSAGEGVLSPGRSSVSINGRPGTLRALADGEIRHDFRHFLHSSTGPPTAGGQQLTANGVHRHVTTTFVPSPAVTPQRWANTSESSPVRATAAVTTEQPPQQQQQSVVWNELLNKYKEQLQQSRSETVHVVKEKRLLTDKALELSNTITKLQTDKEQLRVKVGDLEAKIQFRSNQVSVCLVSVFVC